MSLVWRSGPEIPSPNLDDISKDPWIHCILPSRRALFWQIRLEKYPLLADHAKIMDSIDRRILDALQANGRLSNVELADRVGLSPSPCLRRVRALERAGVILGYGALIDQQAVGLSISVFVQVTLSQKTSEILEAFEAAISQSPAVMECYLMTGEADYHLRVVVPDLASYERYLKEQLTNFPGVAQIQSSIALKQVRYRTALPLPEDDKT